MSMIRPHKDMQARINRALREFTDFEYFTKRAPNYEIGITYWYYNKEMDQMMAMKEEHRPKGPSNWGFVGVTRNGRLEVD